MAAGAGSKPEGKQAVFILDVIGKLIYFYSLADIVFVGGSLIKKGGHNILEPAALAKPVLFGPHMFNFRDIASLFINAKAAILVNNPQELQDRIRELLNNPLQTKKLGYNAKEIVLKNAGATAKNVELIKSIIEKLRG